MIVAGCGSREVLETHSPVNITRVSFDGNWTLNEDPADIARRLNQAIRQTANIRIDVFREQRQGGGGRIQRRASGGLAHVFLENGKALKITQTPTAIFISYDRAVVEEFRFGENREISKGGAVAQRVSGWIGAEYVVETLGEYGMKLTQRLSLAGDRKTLVRRIIFRSRQQQEVTVVATYSRQS